MGVAGNKALLLLHLLEAADLHVLTDNGDLSGQSLIYGLAGVKLPGLSQESVNVSCAGLQCLLCHLCHIALEFLILSHEISLSVNLNCYGLLAVLGNLQHNDTLCCDSAGLLLSGSQSLLSQELYSLVHITLGSGQGLLAVHHSGTGHLS